MPLKRKRSSASLSLSLSSPTSSAFSSPQTPFTSTSLTNSYASEPLPLHLQPPSRTQKRVRDNRPCEEDVYRATMDRLYSSQLQQQSQRGGMDREMAAERMAMADKYLAVPGLNMQGQKTLDAFFRTHAAISPGVSPRTIPKILPPPSQLPNQQPIHRDIEMGMEMCCALCDVQLTDEMVEEVELLYGYGGNGQQRGRGGGRGLACEGCGRLCCGGCSVVGREGRRCVICVCR